MQKKLKGGSIASDMVSSLVDKNCLTDNNNLVNDVKTSGNNDLLSKTYGLLYNTTGGKKSKKMKGGVSLTPSLMKGIPVPWTSKTYDWFMGNKAYQNKVFSREDPISQEFKKPVNHVQPGKHEPLLNDIVKTMAGGKKQNNKKSKNKKMKGSGSDWIASQYSRGSYTAPNMPLDQFKQFNTLSKYISNIELANGAANHFKSMEAVNMPKNNKILKEPVAFNQLNGVPTKSFKGGKKTK